MTKNTLMRLHRIFNTLVAVSIVLAGICFMLGALRIYYNYEPSTISLFGKEIPFPSFVGDKNYSRELVADTFGYIAVPVYLCLALTFGSFIFELASPLNEKKKPMKKRAFVLPVKLEEKHVSVIKWGIIALCCIIFLVYALNGANYAGISSEEVTAAVSRAMLVMAPCLAVSGAAYYFLTPAKVKTEMNGADKVSPNTVNIIRAVVIAAGIGILVFGFLTGGTRDVLTKAVNICTECIGLG